MPQAMSRTKVCIILCILNLVGILLMETILKDSVFYRWFSAALGLFTVIYAARNGYLLRKEK